MTRSKCEQLATEGEHHRHAVVGDLVGALVGRERHADGVLGEGRRGRGSRCCPTRCSRGGNVRSPATSSRRQETADAGRDDRVGIRGHARGRRRRTRLSATTSSAPSGARRSRASSGGTGGRLRCTILRVTDAFDLCRQRVEEIRSGVMSTATRRSSAIARSYSSQLSWLPPAARKMSRSSTRRRSPSMPSRWSSGPASSTGPSTPAHCQPAGGRGSRDVPAGCGAVGRSLPPRRRRPALPAADDRGLRRSPPTTGWSRRTRRRHDGQAVIERHELGEVVEIGHPIESIRSRRQLVARLLRHHVRGVPVGPVLVCRRCVLVLAWRPPPAGARSPDPRRS